MTRPTPDLIDDYAAALGAALDGPARAKARMIEEIRGGLVDAVTTHIGEGLSHSIAVEQAVRQFGTPAELIPDCQRELTIRQTRHTASSLVLTAPALLVCWHLLWVGGDLGLERTLAISLAGVTTVAALHAVVTLLTTGRVARRVGTPLWLPSVTAWAATAAGTTMVTATAALAATSKTAATWPLVVLAVTVTLAAHPLVVTSARSCRRCAHRGRVVEDVAAGRSGSLWARDEREWPAE
jgi:hypothetical protein